MAELCSKFKQKSQCQCNTAEAFLQWIEEKNENKKLSIWYPN